MQFTMEEIAELEETNSELFKLIIFENTIDEPVNNS